MDDFYDAYPEYEPEPEKIYTITLADGTELSNLRLNGNNFVSDTPVMREQFEFNCSPVTISNGKYTEKHENMELVHLQVIDGQYYFVLLDISPEDLWKRKVTADMQYISMMTEVELD